MRTKHILTSLIIFSFCLSSNLLFAGKKQLKLKLKKGDKYTIETSMKSNIIQSIMGTELEIDHFMDAKNLVEVNEKTDDGNFILTYSYLELKTKVSAMGTSLNYDSKSPDESSPLHEMFKKIIELNFQIELTPNGKIVDLKGFEEFLNSVSEGNKNITALPIFANADVFKQNIESNFNYLPKNDISKGDKWSNSMKIPVLAGTEMQIKMDYELLKLKKKYAEIKLDSFLDMNQDTEIQGIASHILLKGNSKGSIIVNPKDGMAKENSSIQHFDMTIKTTIPLSEQVMEVPIKMTTEINSKITKE